MDDELLHYVTQGNMSTNIGPNAKEVLLQQAENEYCNGNTLRSIYFQVVSLYQSSQERYYQSQSDRMCPSAEDLIAGMNAEEAKEFNNNCLIQFVSKALKQTPKEINNNPPANTECNFLQGIVDPLQGIEKLQEICQQLPSEWTILQLCKGPREETTYSIFPKIHESDAAIYLTILKHSRSEEFPTPICLRFAGEEQKELFEKFGSIVQRLKKCVSVDPKDWNTPEAKKLYWKLMGELNNYIAASCADLKTFFYPWNFLFSGKPISSTSLAVCRKRWHKIDAFCDIYNLDQQARVLLSLAADQVIGLSFLEIDAICAILTDNLDQRKLACIMLNEMQHEYKINTYILKSDFPCADDDRCTRTNGCYPCILVVDERLDHFFWEEMNVLQEFSRVNSLQCLWRLYGHYKNKIQNGYLNVNITEGGYVINPDQNLPKMELRMRSFYEYWLPHWYGMVGQRPTQDEFFNKFFTSSCFVYSGHGSGLQYINGRYIAKLQMNCVVFLFGCDSSRLHSNGLYSELVGPHLYYHAAMCPALVGTLMPCLDSTMDKVATEILSRWIAPKSKKVLPWNTIEENAWVKEGIVKSSTSSAGATAATTTTTMATTPNYHMGSLCSVVAKVHQRIRENKMYNTVPYVCRGLPVWNCHVEPLPNTT